MTDTKLLEIKAKIKASPQLSDEEYFTIMAHQNDEQIIDNLRFNDKNYDILDHIIINPE